MTQKEFIARLEEDKFFKNPKEMFEYRFPAVKYWLNNLSNVTIRSSKISFNLKDIQLIQNGSDEEFRLVNHAFEEIKKKLPLYKK